MKKALVFLIISAICLSLFTGCSTQPASEEQIKIPSENINTEHEGVYLTLESISDTSITVVWHNETLKEILIDEWYSIEILRDGEWVSVLTEEMIVPAIEIVIMPLAESHKTYSTSFFNLSERGTYRLRCEFNPGKDRYNTWVEFEVTDENSSDELLVSPADSNIVAHSFPSKNIIALLSAGEWTNDVTDCAHDYIFTLNGKSLRYHSSCGTFIDIEKNRSLTVGDSYRAEINSMLESLFGHWDDSWE